MTDTESLAVNLPLDTLPVNKHGVRHLNVSAGEACKCMRDRMRAPCFECSCDVQRLSLGMRAKHCDLPHNGASLGQGAGLIENDMRGAMQGL